MHLLVIGGSGFLGLRITRQARLAGHQVTATCHAGTPPDADADWRRLDIRRRDDVAALARQAGPDAVVNAAYRQSDWAVTADGGAHVALAAAVAGARLVHVSSDVVFSGAAPGYDESSPPDPVTPYGAAKAAAETAVKGICAGRRHRPDIADHRRRRLQARAAGVRHGGRHRGRRAVHRRGALPGARH